jgi:ClpP class serine protease
MRFNSQQDWHNYLTSRQQNPLTGNELFDLRKDCYTEIEKLRGCPLLIYATKFLDNQPGVANNIDLTDVEGFIDLVNSIENAEEIDVLLHSPGGRPDATERIVHILRERFTRVNF